jgi:hypothetical protein
VGGNEKRSEKCVGGKLKRFINKWDKDTKGLERHTQ